MHIILHGGSTTPKDWEPLINLIEKHHLTIHSNLEYTRHGNDHQKPSIMDLTLSVGP
jgi:hypothetical protein